MVSCLCPYRRLVDYQVAQVAPVVSHAMVPRVAPAESSLAVAARLADYQVAQALRRVHHAVAVALVVPDVQPERHGAEAVPQVVVVPLFVGPAVVDP